MARGEDSWLSTEVSATGDDRRSTRLSVEVEVGVMSWSWSCMLPAAKGEGEGELRGRGMESGKRNVEMLEKYRRRGWAFADEQGLA